MSPQVLVTGGTGQLATAIARARPDVAVTGRPGFDFDHPESIARTLERAAPAIVINTAAWTAVDAAEAHPEEAARANTAGPGQLAAWCQTCGIPFIHISTDYVFDGMKGAPYTEQDAPDPTGVYGRTKLAGEAAVLSAHPGAVILRTSWVYAETGRNFVRTMLGAARRMPSLRVVSDQVGCPTNADDLAACVLAVADRLLDRTVEGEAGAAGLAGVTHAAGTGHTSWHSLACAIFEEAGRHGWAVPDIQAIATADWPTPAARPADSRLDCTRLAEIWGAPLPPWQPSLARAVAAICRAGLDG